MKGQTVVSTGICASFLGLYRASVDPQEQYKAWFCSGCPLQEAFLFNSSSLHLGGPQIVLAEHFLELKVLPFAFFPFIMVGS